MLASGGCGGPVNEAFHSTAAIPAPVLAAAHSAGGYFRSLFSVFLPIFIRFFSEKLEVSHVFRDKMICKRF